MWVPNMNRSIAIVDQSFWRDEVRGKGITTYCGDLWRMNGFEPHMSHHPLLRLQHPKLTSP